MSKSKLFIFSFLLLIFLLSSLINFGAGILERQGSIYLGERNNYWSYFASKSIKSRLYEIQRNNLSILLNKARAADEIKIIESVGKDIDNELERYLEEKEEIQGKAIKYDNLYEKTKKQISILDIAKILAQMTFVSLLILLIMGIEIRRPIIIAHTIPILLSLGLTIFAFW